jgi:importin-9
LTPYLKDFLSLSLLHLNSLYPAFQEHYINASTPAPSSSEDDETIELPQLLCPVIDFVSAVVRGGKSRDWFQQEKLHGLISVIFNVAQMTDEDVSYLFSPAEMMLLILPK